MILRGGIALGLLALSVVILSLSILLPGPAPRYYLMLPGAAYPVGPRVIVPPERRQDVGDLSFTVVFEQRARPFEALIAAARPGVRVVRYEEIIPAGTTEEESTAQYQRMMRESDLTAGAVALRAAGYPIQITGRGARVTGVIPGFPAERTIVAGDVIVGHNEAPVRTFQELSSANARHHPGDEIALTVRRFDGSHVVRLVAAPAPNHPARAMLGVYVETDGFDVVVPFPVSIEERIVGGSSAGLMFALGIYDAVTPGALGGGRRIAGTGSIDLDGQVGAVGGALQKALGADRDGANVFLTPADNLDEVRRIPTRMRIVPIRTFDDALAALVETP